MTALALAGLLALALIVGWAIRFGASWERAGQEMRGEIRGMAIDSEADRSERGLYMDWRI